MAKASAKSSKVLRNQALRQIKKEYKLQDLLLIDTRQAVRPATDETLHQFRVASGDDPNGPQYTIVLNQAGEAMDLAAIEREDGLAYFTTDVAPLEAVDVAGLSALVPGISVTPAENHLELNQGDTHDEVITVTVPADASVPKADIYFLADTTGSMGNILAAVQAGANNILTVLNGLGLDLAFGVGNYRDFPAPPYAFKHQLNPTGVAADVASAIGAWSALGGGDGAEGQIFALDRLAQPPGGSIGWRTGSKRFIVWFGDAPGHDPVCAAISGLAADITEASATAKLVAEGIVVLAISTATPGLDADPQPISSGYTAACGAPGGSAGQGTRIANATGGQFVTGINAANIVQTIIDLITGAVSTINNVHLQPAGATAPFITSITPATGYGPLNTDEAHVLEFKVRFTGVRPCEAEAQVFNGTLDVVVDGVVVVQKRVEIKVPACEREELFSYSVKFVCGRQEAGCCDCPPLRPGAYATEINIYNYHDAAVEIEKRFVPLVLSGAAVGREPQTALPRSRERIELPGHSATMDDCCRIAEVLLGGPAPSSGPLLVGFLQIVSRQELSVTAVYTTSDLASGALSLDVEQIKPQTIQREKRS